MLKYLSMLLTWALSVMLTSSVIAQPPPRGTPPPRPGDGGERPPRPGDGAQSGESAPMDDSILQVTLEIAGYEKFGAALADQIVAGDGAGIDNYFRNSGVVIDEKRNAYFAVNGVHPVNRGDYTSYYPKSIMMASLDDGSLCL